MDLEKQSMILRHYNTLLDSFHGAPPPWYGGAYLAKDEDKIVLAVVKALVNPEADNAISLLGGGGNVRVEPAQFSYAALDALYLEVYERMMALPETLSALVSAFTGVGVLETENRVLITFERDDERLKDLFREHVSSSEAILFGVRSHKQTQMNVEPGGQISFGGGCGTMGYPAKDAGGNRGFITYGHNRSLNDLCSIGGINIGSITQHQDDPDMDASFVKLSSGNSTVPDVCYPPNPKIVGISPQVIVHAAVSMYGAKTKNKSDGIVLQLDVSDSTDKHYMVYSYTSQAGDSGAPILTGLNGNELLAIHLGSFNTTKETFGRLATKINAAFRTTLDVPAPTAGQDDLEECKEEKS